PGIVDDDVQRRLVPQRRRPRPDRGQRGKIAEHEIFTGDRTTRIAGVPYDLMSVRGQDFGDTGARPRLRSGDQHPAHYESSIVYAVPRTTSSVGRMTEPTASPSMTRIIRCTISADTSASGCRIVVSGGSVARAVFESSKPPTATSSGTRR